MPKASCPRLTFKRKELTIAGGQLYAVRTEAWGFGMKLGAITVKYEGLSDSVPYVSYTLVDEAYQRCGIGTKLYQEAAKVACRSFKKPLHSDEERSEPAQRFWEKQIRKGRATCVGHIVGRDDPDPLMPIKGRGGCARYKLSCPAPKDLGRARSPKRR